MKATDTHASEGSQRELAAGVLKQATQDLRRFHRARSESQQELYFDAYSWVMSDDYGWPFSFLNVCLLLGLALADVRHELLGNLSLGVFSQRFASERNVIAAKPVGLAHIAY
jgi:hypothetical protein